MAESSSEIQVNVKGTLGFCRRLLVVLKKRNLGPSELKLQISISTDKTVLELKQAIADKSDVAADRQRLIYSGVLFMPFPHLQANG
jgi:Ubiquitin family